MVEELANIRNIAEEEAKRQQAQKPSLPFRIGQGVREFGTRQVAPAATAVYDALSLPTRAIKYGIGETISGVIGDRPSEPFKRAPATEALSRIVQPTPVEQEAAGLGTGRIAQPAGLQQRQELPRPVTERATPLPSVTAPPTDTEVPAARGFRQPSIPEPTRVTPEPVPSEPETGELAKLQTAGTVGGALGESLGGVPSVDITKVREDVFPIRRPAFAREGGTASPEASIIDNFLSGSTDEVMAKLARGEVPEGLNLAGNISEQLKNLGQRYYNTLDYINTQGTDHPLYNDRILSINDTVNNINEIRELIGRGEATPEAQAAIPEPGGVAPQPAGVRGSLVRDPVTGRATEMFFMGTGAEEGISPREQAQIELAQTRREELVREGESRRGLRAAQTTAAQRAAERGRFVRTNIDVPTGGTDIFGAPVTERRQVLVDPETDRIIDPGERLRRPTPAPAESLRTQFEGLSESDRSIVERQFADRTDITPDEVLTFIRTLNR